MAMWAWRFWLMKLIYFHKMIALMIKQYQAKWIILCGRLKKSWRVSVMSGSTELICLYHIHILIYCAHDLILLWNYFSFEICFLWLKFFPFWSMCLPCCGWQLVTLLTLHLLCLLRHHAVSGFAVYCLIVTVTVEAKDLEIFFRTIFPALLLEWPHNLV